MPHGFATTICDDELALLAVHYGMPHDVYDLGRIRRDLHAANLPELDHPLGGP